MFAWYISKYLKIDDAIIHLYTQYLFPFLFLANRVQLLDNAKIFERDQPLNDHTVSNNGHALVCHSGLLCLWSDVLLRASFTLTRTEGSRLYFIQV